VGALKLEDSRVRGICTSVAAAIVIVMVVVAAGALLIEGRRGTTANVTTYGAQSSVTTSSVWLSTTLAQTPRCANAPESSSQIAIASTSSGPLSIAITLATTDPLNAEPGDQVYIYGLNITDTGQSSYPVNESFFAMMASSNAILRTASVPAIQSSLETTTLSPGQEIGGQIAFQVPSQQTPVLLQYDIPGSMNETIANLPAAVGAVSEPNPSIITNIQYTSDLGFEVLQASAYIPNNPGYFYPSQVIPIVVVFIDTVDGTNEMVNTITSGTITFVITQVSPSLPLQILGYSAGTNYNELVCTYAPQTSFTGNIVLNINANDW